MFTCINQFQAKNNQMRSLKQSIKDKELFVSERRSNRKSFDLHVKSGEAKNNFNQEQEKEMLIAENVQSQEHVELKIYKRQRKKDVSWTQGEDRLLFEKYDSEGSQWVKLVQYFNDKNDNDLKNRFYASLRKIQKLIKKYVLKYCRESNKKKPITIQSLLTILQVGRFNEEYLDLRFAQIIKNFQEILQVRKLIINMALKPEKEITDEQIRELVTKVLNVKHSLKFINKRRVKNSAKKVSQSEKNQILEQQQKQQLYEENFPQKVQQIKQIEPIKPNQNQIQHLDDIFDSFVIQKDKHDLFHSIS